MKIKCFFFKNILLLIKHNGDNSDSWKIIYKLQNNIFIIYIIINVTNVISWLIIRFFCLSFLQIQLLSHFSKLILNQHDWRQHQSQDCKCLITFHFDKELSADALALFFVGCENNGINSWSIFQNTNFHTSRPDDSCRTLLKIFNSSHRSVLSKSKSNFKYNFYNGI